VTVATFDTAPTIDRIEEAIASAADPRRADATRWAWTEDAAFWGPPGVAGGAPLVAEEGPRGPVLIVDGQRIATAADGAVTRVGMPGRVGYCAAWAVEAVSRLVEAGRAPSLVFGRALGAHQTWAECDGLVFDQTLSEKPFDRGAYLRDLHARAGTTVQIPDAATLAALLEAIADGAWEGWRPETLSTEALARRRQKE
jgi:hypothetical protein